MATNGLLGDGPLGGIRVVEIGGGVAAAWCARMLADLGASVRRLEPEGGDPLRRRRELPDAPRTEGLLFAWLDQGKQDLPAAELEAAVAESELLLVGEAAPRHALAARPMRASIELSWFGLDGPLAHWRGADSLVQALTGMIFPCGPVQGPPHQLGDIQAAVIGGATAMSAALAALLDDGGHRRVEVSILEACMVLGELQVADAQMHDRPVPRLGVNRFLPTCPISIHRCREGWLGTTVITPAQWAAFCGMLERPDLAADPGLATIHLRAERADELEAILDERFREKTAHEWAAIAREMKVPLVVVPDAGELAAHPVFTRRGTIAPLADRPELIAPGSPLRVAAPGVAGDPAAGGEAARLGAGARADAGRDPGAGDGRTDALLAGLRVTDFSMGWAGPIATRILADLGADVIKVEAGRYPDWWRGTQWEAEAIAARQHEKSCRFAAVNRGKRSVSFDLTTPEGRELARRLVAASDVAVENHAAGVIDRLGMGWPELSRDRDDLVMLSMSAFGSGNELSDTRAYGSTLEQASGMPSFRGEASWPPMMGHIAYGDPIGGLYGAAAILAALVHRRRTGQGQWLNISQVECLLPFTAPALLVRSATGREPPRIGNRHVAMVPHGVYPAAGEDRWIVIAADSPQAWRALARTIGREDWLDPALEDVEARRAREDGIDAALADWTRGRDALETSGQLQELGVLAAPVLTPEETMQQAQHAGRDFYFDTRREHIGEQRQIALAWRIDGRRLPLSGTAPLLGADTLDVMRDVLDESRERYEALMAAGVISLEPTTLRSGPA